MSVLEALIGVLAPPRCGGCSREGSGLCEACAAAEIIPYGARCWRCGALSPNARTCVHCRSFGGPRYVWVCTDYAGLAAKLVSAYKFGHQRFMARSLGQLMAGSFLSHNSDDRLARSNYLVTGLPAIVVHRRRRGFDHADLLARKVAAELRLEYRSVLGRLDKSRQVGRRRSERLKLSPEILYARQPLVGRNILLIDDVLTTGATLRAATKSLRRAGAKHVDALVFAKKL